MFDRWLTDSETVDFGCEYEIPTYTSVLPQEGIMKVHPDISVVSWMRADVTVERQCQGDNNLPRKVFCRKLGY